MRVKLKGIGSGAKIVVLITALLLIVNIAIGGILVYNSRSDMRKLIDDRMLGIVETAAALLDGDVLATLTEKDAGGEKQKAIIEKLESFVEHFDIIYIYVVRPAGDGSFIFIADADPVDPALFGETVEISPAIKEAGEGRAAVDSVAVGDRWGKHYSAYCPVNTSSGEIGGIVGVDFDAEWYEDQMTRNTLYLLFFCAVSLMIGGAIILLVTARLRKKFDKLSSEMNAVAADLNALMSEIGADRAYTMTPSESRMLNASDAHTTDGDSIENLGREISVIKNNLKRYIAFVHEQAYTDGMTGVGNKAAYLDLVRGINEEIAKGAAPSFAICVFDFNGLKTINDERGHETGDEMIVHAAGCIRKIFGVGNVFRIGGDEFIAVLSGFSKEDMKEAMTRLDAAIAEENGSLPEDKVAFVSFSKGVAFFRPGEDHEFREIFKRADEEMYKNKEEYYRTHGRRFTQ